MQRFAITGASGAVARRHLRAIAETGNRVVAALDVRDSAAVLDEFDFDIPFFTDSADFEAHLRALPASQRIDYLSICTPNFLHPASCRLGLELGADVICEKPIAICPQDLIALEELERQTGKRVWTVLQLRTVEALEHLRSSLRERTGTRHAVSLTYVSARGRWYDHSWKANEDKSGGLAVNIGIHMFDLLIWLFGEPKDIALHLREPRRLAGELELERASVQWFLSIEPEDLPEGAQTRTHRSLVVDGAATEFSYSSSELHTRVYQRVLSGAGCGIRDAWPSIELSHRIQHIDVTARDKSTRDDLKLVPE